MNNTMWLNIKSAITSGIIMAIIGIAGYIIGVADLWKVDYHALVNVAVMSFLTTAVSLIKAGLTSDSGKVAGIQIIDKKK